MNNVIMTSLFALPSKWNNAMDAAINNQHTSRVKCQATKRSKDTMADRFC